MAKPVRASYASEHRKAMVKTLQSIGGGKYRTHQVFCDWVEMLAIALSNAVDKSQYVVREARYMQLSKQYDSQELTQIAGLLNPLLDEFSRGDDGIFFDDVLGDVFMSMDFGSDARGQFFTPYPISNLMAKMIMASDTHAKIEAQGFVRLSEPTCGAGGMCIAAAQSLYESGINYQQSIHITAQDVDRACVHMTYIQLTLLHVPAVVILGNTLALEEREHWYTPAHFIGGWDARLAMREFMETVGVQRVVEPAAVAVEVVDAQTVKESLQVEADAGQMCLF